MHRRVIVGYSVERRPIVALETGDPDSSRRVLVVGCIHGNETAGMAIVAALSRVAAPHEVDMWLVTTANPDGVALRARGNAHGVDLNRNFPYRWRRLGRPGTTYYSGARALSEPETRGVAALLRRVRPSLGIWYHQALALVDASEGPLGVVRRYAAHTRLPVARLPDYPGSAVGYENRSLGPTAFVVELPAGPLSRTQTLSHVRAVLDVAR